MSQALYRKWRPRHWDQVVGQGHILQTLTNALRAGRVGHAYLFAGPRGTGKTTVARLVAKTVNCLEEELPKRPCNRCEHCQAVDENRFLDLIEIDAASNTSVDDVRDLRDKINFSPTQGRYKVYIIDEVHMLSTAAFNALLKTLEEPPPHAIFVLATTEIHKIPATVLSRCQRHEFRRVPVDETIAQLERIAEEEGIKIEGDALMLIARQAAGGLRDAISLLDQLASTGEKIDLQLAQAVLGTATSQTVLDMIASIRDERPASGMDALHSALDSGADPRSLAHQIVEYLRGLLLVQLGNHAQVEVTQEVLEHMREHAQVFSTKEVLHMLKAFNSAATSTRGGWQPSLGLELALAEMFQAGAETSKPEPRERTPTRKKEKKTAATARKKTQKAETAQEVTPESPVISLSQVVEAWSEIREAIKPTHPALDGLLNSCKPMEVRGNVLVLGFQSDAVRELMEKPDQIDFTCKVIKEVLGIDLSIECAVTNAQGKLPSDVNPDGMVATAIQNGGEIVDMQE